MKSFKAYHVEENKLHMWVVIGRVKINKLSDVNSPTIRISSVEFGHFRRHGSLNQIDNSLPLKKFRTMEELSELLSWGHNFLRGSTTAICFSHPFKFNMFTNSFSCELHYSFHLLLYGDFCIQILLAYVYIGWQ